MSDIDNDLIFDARLPNGKIELFSFQDYLTYREWLGVPVDRRERSEIIKWLNSDNLSRLSVYLGIIVAKRHMTAP